MIKTKKWRKRGDDADESEDTNKPSQVVESKSGSKKDKAKKETKSAGPKLLSFVEDEDEGEESFVSKKEKGRNKPSSRTSLLSFEDDQVEPGLQKSKKKAGFGTGHGSGHMLGLTKEKAQGLPAKHSNVQAQPGEYTKERLLELQRNAIRLGGSNPVVETKPSEPIVVLKGLIKPSSEPEEKDSVDALNRKVIVDDEAGRLRKEKDDAESRLGLMGIGSGAEGGGITHIPDAAVIAAAKAKRERLRQAQSAPDYIPLGGGEPNDLRSRLQESRDQDGFTKGEVMSSDDETEVQGRLAFLGENGKKKGGVFESMEDKLGEEHVVGPRDEDEEDEERKWEEEQLRKGAGKRVEDAATRIGIVSSQDIQNSSYVQAPIPSDSSSWTGWGQNLEALSVTQQAEAVIATLQQSITHFKASHGRVESDLYRTEENLAASKTSVTSLEKSLAAAGEKYIYMQELKDYVSVLCDFLKKKGPLIEELEEHMQRLHEERANAVTERRAADNSDEKLEVDAAVNAAMSILNKGGSSANASAVAAAAAAAAISARDALNTAVQLDEFGRDVNLQKRRDVKRRADARHRRMAKRGLSNGAGGKVEGESSSDESDSEMSAYQSGREEVLQTAKQIFGDAIEEYSKLNLVKRKLEGWKQQYPTAYRDAYMSISAPAIFAPYVRLELLKWDPLYGDIGFDTMQWYTLLFDYGMPENGQDMEPGDKDSDLVPNLVEKVALPILHHEIAHCWDKLSTRGTTNAVAAVQEILVYVPATSDTLQELLADVRRQLAEEISTLEVPSWTLQLTNSVSQAACFVAQRFGVSVRLLRNIGLWKDIIAKPALEQLALDQLLCGKILPHLRVLLPTIHDAVTRTERVIAALSGVWVGPNFPELSSKLEPFTDYVTTLARTLEKKRDSGISTEDMVGIARRIKRMLVELNKYDRARQLAKTFQLKEAL